MLKRTDINLDMRVAPQAVALFASTRISDTFHAAMRYVVAREHLRRIGGLRVVVTGLIALSTHLLTPGAAFALEQQTQSESPDALAFVTATTNSIKARNEPGRTYIDPRFAVQVASMGCSVDDVSTLKVVSIRPRSRVVDIALSRTDEVVEIGLSGIPHVPQDRSGTVMFGCGIFNKERDTYTPVRKNGKGRFVAAGTAIRSSASDHYVVLPFGGTAKRYRQNIRLRFARPISTKDIRSGTLAVRITQQWKAQANNTLGKWGGTATGVFHAFKRKGQFINPRRTNPVQASSTRYGPRYVGSE